MGIFWCISITNNVESCKKFNEKAQTANFSVLARGRRPHQELFAKNMKTRETETPEFIDYQRKEFFIIEIAREETASSK